MMLGDKLIVFTNLEGREDDLAALMARFKVSGYRKWVGKRALPEFFFVTGKIDFFLAQLRQAGFEFEERAGDLTE